MKKAVSGVLALILLTALILPAVGLAEDSNIIFDPSIEGMTIDNDSVIQPRYEPCDGIHRHNSKLYYTGQIKLSNPPWYEVCCYWCREDYRWVKTRPY